MPSIAWEGKGNDSAAITFRDAAELPEPSANPSAQVQPSTPSGFEGLEQVPAPGFEVNPAKCFDCADLVTGGAASDCVNDYDDDRVKTPGMGGEGFEPP